MSAVFDKIEGILTDAYSVSNYVDLMNEILDDLRIVAPNSPRKEFTNFSSHIESSTHVGNYTSPDGKKIIVMAVELKSQTYVENSRSTQRSYAKRLIENANADAALVAFFTPGDPRWRLSFVRLDYEMKIENGKLKTAENMTPARRYSFLVGKDEPCHTAIERFRLFLEKHDANPTLDDLENAFSVEAVTKEFFELYCEKYHQLREALEKNADFVEEAKLHNYTSAQFAKKLMGQIVFLYFLQKKGWLGVSAWPRQLSATDYKKAFFARGAKSRELIPVVYQQVDENTYRVNATALNALSNEDEEFLSTCVRGEPWGSGPHNFMRRLFETSDRKGANFYDDYLEPLFYEALNVNRGDQGYDPALHCRIPFLSGGLFEPIDGYDWKHNRFAIPNDIFSNKKDHKDRLADGILDIFDRYNFTMSEDEPLEREVAIDPEMLGKVFENLLDVNDRKSKGAFYTPREIVHYMCQESLINYLTNTMKVSEMAIRDFILYGDFMKDEDASVLKRAEKGDSYALWVSEELYELNPDGTIKTDRMKELDKALQDVRVADPAVGSGAFPLGMLNEIVRARQNITTYMDITQKIIDPKGASREIRYRRINDRSARQLKYDTIRNCIFAVDIEPSAVDIAQLRLWLALVIDDEIDPNAISALDGHRNPLPLPNLECNILCGNSLIDEFEGIKLINESDIIGTAGDVMQVNLYQSAFDATLQRLIEKQEELFKCDDTVKKAQLLQDIDALRDEVIMSQLRGQASAAQMERFYETKALASKPFALWQLDFARVFREKGGFDIVIGNPPYVRVQNLSHEMIDMYKKRWSTAWKRIDISTLFYELGFSIIDGKGTINYIASNQFITTEYGRSMRHYLVEKRGLQRIIDFKDLKVFQNAMTYVSIFVMNNQPKQSIQFYEVPKLPFVAPNTFVDIDYSRLNDEPWKLGNNDIADIVEKIEKITSIRLKDIASPGCGLITGKDDLLMFDIDADVDFESEMILPIIRAQGCGRYIEAKPSKKVVYPYKAVGENTVLLSLEEMKTMYPKTYTYLMEHEEELKARKDSRETFGMRKGWYGLVRFGQLANFRKPKICTPGEVRHNKFCIDYTQSGFSCARVFSITLEDSSVSIEYFLSLLNSSIVEFYLHHIASLKAGGYYSYSTSVLERIPVIIPQDQKEYIDIVKTIMLKQKDGLSIEKEERQLNTLFYKLFNITETEAAIIEKDIQDQEE